MAGFIAMNEGSGTAHSTGFINNADGTVDLEVYCATACTLKTGVIVVMGTCGWSYKSETLPSGTQAWGFAGFPKKTAASNTWNLFQVGGYIKDAILGASCTGTIGAGVEWVGSTLTGVGGAACSSTGQGNFGVFAGATVGNGTATHDLMLFPLPIECNLA